MSLKPTSLTTTKPQGLKKIGAGLSAVKPVQKNAFKEKERELRGKRKAEAADAPPSDGKRPRPAE